MAAQDYEQVTYNGTAGAQMGSSPTEKIGFYGATPIVRATVAATTTTTATTGALQADIDAIRTALQNLGLIG